MLEFRVLRRQGSNLRPSGYEPDELPLLYFAISDCKGNAHLLIRQIYFFELPLQRCKQDL